MEGLRLAGDVFDFDIREGLKNDKIENLLAKTDATSARCDCQ